MSVREEGRANLYCQAVSIIAQNMNQPEKQVEKLRKIGFGHDEAHRISALAPAALSRAVIEELVDLNWGATVSVGDREFRLDRQPEYEALLLLARFHRRHGFFDHESFKTVAQSSSEIDAISNALNAGRDLSGSAIATALVDPRMANHLLP